MRFDLRDQYTLIKSDIVDTRELTNAYLLIFHAIDLVSILAEYAKASSYQALCSGRLHVKVRYCMHQADTDAHHVQL
jgi:hypothetical protein